MSATLDTKPKPTHREITPIRECKGCGAYLRTGNESTRCDPCSKGPVDVHSREEIIQRIAEMTDIRHRRRAFEALAEMEISP